MYLSLGALSLNALMLRGRMKFNKYILDKIIKITNKLNDAITKLVIITFTPHNKPMPQSNFTSPPPKSLIAYAGTVINIAIINPINADDTGSCVTVWPVTLNTRIAVTIEPKLR